MVSFVESPNSIKKNAYLFQLSHSTSWTKPSNFLHIPSQYLLFLGWGSQGHYTVCIHLQCVLLFVYSCQVPRTNHWLLSACCHHCGETSSRKFTPQSTWKQIPYHIILQHNYIHQCFPNFSACGHILD